VSRVVDVHLGGPTPYQDYPAIPERFARSFKLWVFDVDEGDGMQLADRVQGPGERDIVSEAIFDQGVWEVPETILLMSAFAAYPRAQFVDFGCHVGWYSTIASTFGLDVVAVDSNPAAIALLARTWRENGFQGRLSLLAREIDEGLILQVPWEASTIIVKIDIEGAERHAVKALWRYFEDGTITHCLMEVSPCFNDTYPDLLGSLFDLGYVGYVMPRKVDQPKPIGDIPRYLASHCRRLDFLTRDSMAHWVRRQHQFDLIAFRSGARWG
jgi:hypothetical protein